MSEGTTLGTSKRTIGKHEYAVTIFPAGHGLELLIELKNALGDSAGSLFGQNVEGMIAKIGGSYSKSEIRDLVQRLLDLTFVGSSTEPLGKKEIFDNHFAGQYGQLMKVLGFVIEVNYSDFFDELKSGIARVVGRLETVLQTMGIASGDSKSPKPSATNG